MDEIRDRANLIENYIIIEDKETELISRLKALETILESGVIDDAELHLLSKRDFSAFRFNKHLYNPLRDRIKLKDKICP